MMSRRKWLLLSGISLLAVHLHVRSQETARVRRVGILLFTSSDKTVHLQTAFKQGMRDLGWLEGQTIEYQFVFAEGHVERLDGLARMLVAQQADVLVTPAATMLLALQKATKKIPIVMTNVPGAVENNFVISLSRPGGNITGVTSQMELVLGKQIEILHEVVPNAKRIAFLMNETSLANNAYWNDAQSACAALKLAPIRVAANAPDQLAAAVARIVSERAQAVVVFADSMFYGEREKIADLLRAIRLPAAYGLSDHVVAGGLLSYAADLAENFRHSAIFVDKILKGARPEDLPVEQPTRFDLVINLKTAKALGLTIPQSVLIRANRVIE